MKFAFLFTFLLSSLSFSLEIGAGSFTKIQASLKLYKATNFEMKLPDESSLKAAATEGTKTVKEVLANWFGTKKQISQALQDFSGNNSVLIRNNAASLLAINYLRFSDPNMQNASDSLSKKSDFSENEFQKMKLAFEEVMTLSEKMKNFAQQMNPEQIKFVSKDNPNPNLPRFLLWPLGTDQKCTEEMVQKIRSELGSENFKALGSSMMLTGSSYEGLYEQLYLRRIIEVLRNHSSEDSRIIFTYVAANLNEDQVLSSYHGFMKFINQGEEEFVKYCSGKCSKQDARTFFQGYARKYPYCLGVISPEYSKLRKIVNN